MSDRGSESTSHRHGNIFSRHSGAMLIHVQRENGLAHRTMSLRPWQVQLLRVAVSRWFVAILAIAVCSWGYFAVQAARVALVSRRLVVLEADALRLDTLQRALTQLQQRYDQVQKMMSAQNGARGAGAGSPTPTPPTATAPSNATRDSTKRVAGNKSKPDTTAALAVLKRTKSAADTQLPPRRKTQNDSASAERKTKTDSSARKP